VRPGDLALPFSLPDEQGITRTLGEFLARGPVVLFFYPAAMSPGCTAESCHFRDLRAEFAALGATRLGISRDDPTAQRRFSDRHGFDFPLLSDAQDEVAENYGVRRHLRVLPTKRRTFVIGTDGRVAAVIKSETRMAAHADRALAILREMAAT
jgi:peroxiredoxin Q/BCP